MDEGVLSDVERSPRDCCDTARLVELEEVDEEESQIDGSEGDDAIVGCLMRDRERKRDGDFLIGEKVLSFDLRMESSTVTLTVEREGEEGEGERGGGKFSG
jgi:hypothetical protein